MKLYVRSSDSKLGFPIIRVQVWIEPILYEDSDILSAVEYKDGKWVSDNNSSRIINGPLSGPGEELEPPISDEYDKFIEDCKFIIEHCGFTIIHCERSDTSNKSEYILLFGMNDHPYGKLIFDFRISDHPLDSYNFPDRLKKIAEQYLTMNNILDGTASSKGIDFQIEKVLVGSVKNDTWDRAINRLANRLNAIRNKIRIAIRNESNN